MSTAARRRRSPSRASASHHERRASFLASEATRTSAKGALGLATASMSSSSSSSSSSTRRRGNLPTQTAWQRVEGVAHRAELFIERLFRRHGRNIARHPVQTLLLACLLITSLFYPAVGIFLWSSKGGPGVTRGDARSVWRSLSTPLLDSFASSGRKHHNSLRDLRMIWDDATDLNAIDARDFDAYSHGFAAAEWVFGSHGGADYIGSANGTRAHDEHQSSCRSLQMEHVLVSTDDVIMGFGERHGALHLPILRSALNLQRAVEAVLSDKSKERPGNLSMCITSPDGHCLTLSPLSYWGYDDAALSDDPTPAQTVLQSRLNHTMQGVPLTHSTTLAGRSHLFRHLPRADHLALTFFLEDAKGCEVRDRSATGASHEPRALRDVESESHKAWLKMLRSVTGNHVKFLGADSRAPKETILQFSPRHPTSTFPLHKVILFTAYIGMVAWLTRHFIKMRKVHSKFGLAFTTCVELIISMTLAISISALSGLRLTLLPWEILPFVIIVIGSENASALTNAIVSTPITLTVTSRVATGLGKAGVPIAITVLSDVALMATISLLVDVQAVRDFCTFAIFALLVDFVMQMTFYATVLSIDLQRLELADLLSADYGRGAKTSYDEDESIHSDAGHDLFADQSLSEDRPSFARSPSGEKTSFIKQSCRAVWRARTARTVSLSFLLALLFGIYIYHGSGYSARHVYKFSSLRSGDTPAASYPLDAQTPTSAEPTFDPYSHLSSDGSRHTVSPPNPWWHDSPSARFWQILNPDDAAEVRVKIEPWTLISLHSASAHLDDHQKSFASWAIFRPRIRAFIWFLKLVVLPIAGTTALLWILLLYLLKDTELLEAQQTKLDSFDHDDILPKDCDADSYDETNHLDASIFVEKAAHAADVLLVAAEGKFVVSIDTDWHFHVWRLSRRGTRSLHANLGEKLGTAACAPSALALSAVNGLAAIGHTDGTCTLLSLSTLQVVFSSIEGKQGLREASSKVLRCSISLNKSSDNASQPAILYTVHQDGRVVRRIHPAFAAEVLLAPTPSGSCSVLDVSRDCAKFEKSFALLYPEGRLKIFGLGESGMVDLAEVYNVPKTARSIAVFQHRPGESRSRQAQGLADSFVAVGTSTGQVSVYSASSAEIVAKAQTLESAIRKVAFIYIQHSEEMASDRRAPATLMLVVLARARALVFTLISTDIPHSSDQSNATLNPINSSLSAEENHKAARTLSVSNGTAKILAGPPSPSRPAMQLSATDAKKQNSLHLVLDINCSKGGADIDVVDGIPRLLAICRTEFSTVHRNERTPIKMLHPRARWHVTVHSLTDILANARNTSDGMIVERSNLLLNLHRAPYDRAVQRMGLPIEEIAASAKTPMLASTFASPAAWSGSSRPIQQRHNNEDRFDTLSFTQLDFVRALAKTTPSTDHDQVPDANLSGHGTSGGLFFVFGNTLCVVAFRKSRA